jgi:winged helix DNA-binding protein
MTAVTRDQALAWRMRRQFLDPPGTASAVEVTRRLAGVQAQVASAAELCIALRQADPSPGEPARALWEERTLVKTWAMRGTLHLLPADEAGAYLALCGTIRNWERPIWQRETKLTPADMEAMAESVTAVLAGGACLTRERLAAEIVERLGREHLAEPLASGWGTLLKPLAWWGVLCFGPPAGNRVTFCSPAARIPGWRGVPPIEEAVRTVLRGYFGAHGPASADAFSNWLMRRMNRKSDLKAWFAVMADELATVEVDGAPLQVPHEHVEELLETPPTEAVRMLGGFDHYVLGAGTDATYLIPAERRAEVSRAAGWISPVIVHRGRVVGVWDAKTGERTLWEDVPADALRAEADRLAALR